MSRRTQRDLQHLARGRAAQASQGCIGQGEVLGLLVAIRAHGNNAELVPLAIVMMLLAGLCGGSPMILHIIGTP